MVCNKVGREILFRRLCHDCDQWGFVTGRSWSLDSGGKTAKAAPIGNRAVETVADIDTDAKGCTRHPWCSSAASRMSLAFGGGLGRGRGRGLSSKPRQANKEHAFWTKAGGKFNRAVLRDHETSIKSCCVMGQLNKYYPVDMAVQVIGAWRSLRPLAHPVCAAIHRSCATFQQMPHLMMQKPRNAEKSLRRARGRKRPIFRVDARRALPL